MYVKQLDRCVDIDVFFFEDVQYLLRLKLFVSVVGNIFDSIAHFLAHLRWNPDAVGLIQKDSDAALSRLAVDTVYVCLVLAAQIFRIDGQIRNGPFVAVVGFSPCHTLAMASWWEPENAANTSCPAYGCLS